SRGRGCPSVPVTLLPGFDGLFPRPLFLDVGIEDTRLAAIAAAVVEVRLDGFGRARIVVPVHAQARLAKLRCRTSSGIGIKVSACGRPWANMTRRPGSKAVQVSLSVRGLVAMTDTQSPWTLVREKSTEMSVSTKWAARNGQARVM